MNYLSLFSGAGGFEWFAKLMGWRCVGYVEKDEFCQQVLRARIRDGIFDDAPIFSDVRTFDGRPYRGKVDCITAGFPCQPHSSAARGRNTAVCLSGELLRVVSEVLPRYVFVENVSRKAINDVGDRLESLGFCCKACSCSAADLGGDHIRKRYWLFAHTDGESELLGLRDAEVEKLPKLLPGIWEAYTDELRVADGMAHRSDRLRALGNGIVPAVAREAWWRLTA